VTTPKAFQRLAADRSDANQPPRGDRCEEYDLTPEVFTAKPWYSFRVGRVSAIEIRWCSLSLNHRLSLADPFRNNAGVGRSKPLQAPVRHRSGIPWNDPPVFR